MVELCFLSAIKKKNHHSALVEIKDDNYVAKLSPS